jgi:hypothetical protein
MTIAAILETLVGASALLVGVIYIVGGLIVNLHLANYGVTEYQILRVKYFVVGITFVTNAIAILFLASIPGFLILTLDFYVQQLFLIASLSASVLLLWVWAKPVESERRFLFTWRFWILAGSVASVYPLSVAIRMMIVPQMTFESGLMLVAGFLTLAIKTAGGVMSLVTGVYLDLIRFPKGVPVSEISSGAITELAAFVAVFCVVGAAGVASVIRRLDVSLAKQQGINRELASRLAPR